VTENTPAPASRRPLYIILAAVGALLIIIIVLLVVLLNELQAQEAQRAWEACLARHGIDVTAPVPTDAGYVDRLVDAGEACIDD
jgi:hypothetical protein